MYMLLVIAVVVFLLLVCAIVVAVTEPMVIRKRKVMVTPPGGGAPVEEEIPETKWSFWGGVTEVTLIPMIGLLSIAIFLLVVPSDMMVQSRLGLWNMLLVDNPDSAHSVYDPPQALVVTDGQATFEIPQGIQPLWIVVTLGVDDSYSVPLDCVKTSKDDTTKQTIRTVTYKNKLISAKKPLKAMYGIATGPSGETVWKVEGETATSTVTAGSGCCHDDPST